MEKSLDENFLQMLESLSYINDENKLQNPQNENMLNLAYVGDVIFDMYISDKLIRKYNGKKKINEINKIAQSYLCAKGQARIIEKWIDDSLLKEEEIGVYKHGRNASSHTKSKNSTIVDYRKATGFEALLAYLYYRDELDRLFKLLQTIEV